MRTFIVLIAFLFTSLPVSAKDNGSNRSTHSDLTVNKQTDKSSPTLMQRTAPQSPLRLKYYFRSTAVK
jgi:type VI protein secretion system component Hcp